MMGRRVTRRSLGRGGRGGMRVIIGVISEVGGGREGMGCSGA